MRNNDDGDYKRSRDNPWPSPNRHRQEKPEDMKQWGILVFGFTGATLITFAVGQLRQSVDWFFSQLTKSPSSGKSGTGCSFRSSFQEEAWKRYNRRMQNEYEEEMERVERMRRMQSVFNRERSKYKRSYESLEREWSREAPQGSATYALSHHYSVLGLNWLRTRPYTDGEIKTAFRAKAMQYHPDQNQDNKELAEVKFKEVMTSFEAIKTERKSNKP
ncbi:hypothetical protein Vadar_002777 [Vaccinium darrowii]|uniref:Uncharacterized protein n=1 Tax=Vaccinium darrowii TaxID=229202 RepID=A0ACB7ZA62_9ERIC|nr:hypothetical protein Vadar_002777 [Vaccinium darrowii]